MAPYFSDDQLDSVMVPVGYSLTIYSDDNLTGESKAFDGIEDGKGRLVCQNVGDDFHDKTTSFKFTKNSSPTPA